MNRRDNCQNIPAGRPTARGTGKRRRSRGAVYVEFALVALLYFSTSLQIFNFCFWVFAKSVLQQAVREGTRYAITGRSMTGMGQDASIRQAVKNAAFHLLDAPSAESRINIQYYAADGSGATASNGAGNIVVVSVVDFPAMPLFEVVGAGSPLVLNVSSVDKVEPLPGVPPPRTLGP